MIQEPKNPYYFQITDATVAKACVKDNNHCVVAESVRETSLSQGKQILAIQVGPKRTTIIMKGRELRYSTPNILENAIRTFDRTGEWPLPAGKYKLEPLPKSLTRTYVKARSIKRREDDDPNMIKKPVSRHRYKKTDARTLIFEAEKR